VGLEGEAIRVWFAVQVDLELGFEGEEGTPTGGGMMPTAMGTIPTVTVATTVLVAVAITELGFVT
jgi:hypothetical protein